MNAPAAADDTRGSTRGGSRATAPVTAAAARARVRELLHRAGIDLDSVTAADALLVTSELVTNAIRHGGGITAFHTEIADDALHLSVSDASPRAPSPRTGTLDRPGGLRVAPRPAAHRTHRHQQLPRRQDHRHHPAPDLTREPPGRRWPPPLVRGISIGHL